MLIVLDEWKAVQRTKQHILDVLDMMESENVAHFKFLISVMTGELVDVETFMQAMKDLLTMDEIKATVINTETIIITHSYK